MTSADSAPLDDRSDSVVDLSSESASMDLIQQARAGDAAALSELIDTYRAYLLHVANREMGPSLNQKLGASDLVQSACLEIQNRFKDFRGESAGEWRKWLRRMLVNDVKDARRRFQEAKKRDVSRERRLYQSDGAMIDPPADWLSPRAEAIAAEEAALLNNAMAALSEEYQTVLRLRNWDELSFPEIGAQMDRTDEAARKLWARAIARLQQEVDRLTADPGGNSR